MVEVGMKSNKRQQPLDPSESFHISKKRCKSKWKWVEGTVDPKREHFNLLYEDSGRLYKKKMVIKIGEVTAEGGFDVVALVGRGRGNTYVVRFPLRENLETHQNEVRL
jgi:hypothetical protein